MRMRRWQKFNSRRPDVLKHHPVVFQSESPAIAANYASLADVC